MRIKSLSYAAVALTWGSGCFAQPTQNDLKTAIATVACSTFASEPEMRKNVGAFSDENASPFGVPYLEWTQTMFDTLHTRVNECGNPVVLAGMTAWHTIEVLGSPIPVKISRIADARRERDYELAANELLDDLMRSMQALPATEQRAQLSDALSNKQEFAFATHARDRLKRRIDDLYQVIQAEQRAAQDQARQKRQEAEQQQAAQQANDEVRLKATAQQLLAANGASLNNVGFPAGMLDSNMMLWDGGRYVPILTLRQYLSVLAAAPGATVTSISGWNNTRPGFGFKRPNVPRTLILFRQEGNELYLDSGGSGDTVEKVEDRQQQTMSMTLIYSYQAILAEYLKSH